MAEDPNLSPFVHHWTDPEVRDRYMFHAKEIYETNKQMVRVSQSAHIDYAKWLLASMLAIHGGSIYAISNLRREMQGVDGASLEILAGAAAMNVAGIVFTILTAAMAWLNFQAAERNYERRANPAIVYRNDKFDDPTKGKTDPIGATYVLAIACAALSLALFIASSVDVFRTLSSVAAR